MSKKLFKQNCFNYYYKVFIYKNIYLLFQTFFFYNFNDIRFEK